jgi:osomolarity two-component system response regulator SSK1
MQALIDFDGWRKWKDFSQVQQLDGDEMGDKKKGALAKKKKNRVSVGSNSGLGGGLGGAGLGKKSEVGMVGGP